MGSIYGFVDFYRCATALFLVSFLVQPYCVIIDRCVNVPGNGREVVDVINTNDKIFLFQLITTMQLTGSKGYNTHMLMHYETSTHDASLSQELKNNCIM